MIPEATQTWPLPEPYDFFETTRTLRTGERDPTLRREADGLWRTAHTVAGPVTVRLIVSEGQVEARAWGPGAAVVLEDVPRWIGLHEAPWELPAHPVVDRLGREHPGLRLADTRDLFEGLVNTILQQLVTWNEAAMTWRRLCEELGEPAPGPTDLLSSPTAPVLRTAGTGRLRSAGIGDRRARTLMEVARVASAVRRAGDLPTPEAVELLQKIRGIGPWTASYVLGMRLGRPELPVLADLHLPNTISWALAGEPRGTEEQMLELLAPFQGQAFRVIRLVFAARLRAPRRGPRRTWRRS